MRYMLLKVVSIYVCILWLVFYGTEDNEKSVDFHA
jgi:hypothetical protein